LAELQHEGINPGFLWLIMLLPPMTAEVENHPGGVLPPDPTQWSSEHQTSSLPPQFTEEKQ